MSHDKRFRCHAKLGYGEAIKSKLKHSVAPGKLLEVWRVGTVDRLLDCSPVIRHSRHIHTHTQTELYVLPPYK
jgi:hypothetical protein